MIATTLQSLHEGDTHCSNHTMAREAADSRIWLAFGMHPHRQAICKLSIDPPFVERVRAIVGL